MGDAENEKRRDVILESKQDFILLHWKMSAIPFWKIRETQHVRFI